MKGKFNVRLGVLCAILSAMLVVPAWAQAKKETGDVFKERREQMVKSLKLAPEKEKAILTLEERYAKDRKEIISGMRKANTELEEAMKAAKPDDAKIKALVEAITAGQDKLFASFKSQRDEEMGQMTPVEQGKYLMAMNKWREEMAAKFKKEAAAKK